ncbi:MULTISPECIES: hypothetical protein [Salinibaculum]|uniref:hypothetical protein n=1 Tax=Salinibaculum TaxID=2732368 RepID=UPI0030CB96AF
MLPPVVRRCPACGHVGLTPRFPARLDGDEWTVECPACGHRFEPPDTPWVA